MAEKKGFMGEFKEFIMRGNVMDMAVGIIIGGAFTAIVNSLVGDILTPILGVITGGIDFSGLALTVGSAEIKYGKFIQSVISFLIIAFVIFSLIKAINKIARKKPEAPKETKPSAEVQLLTEIRDALKK